MLEKNSEEFKQEISTACQKITAQDVLKWFRGNNAPSLEKIDRLWSNVGINNDVNIGKMLKSQCNEKEPMLIIRREEGQSQAVTPDWAKERACNFLREFCQKFGSNPEVLQKFGKILHEEVKVLQMKQHKANMSSSDITNTRNFVLNRFFLRYLNPKLILAGVDAVDDKNKLSEVTKERNEALGEIKKCKSQIPPNFEEIKNWENIASQKEKERNQLLAPQNEIKAVATYIQAQCNLDSPDKEIGKVFQQLADILIPPDSAAVTWEDLKK